MMSPEPTSTAGSDRAGAASRRTARTRTSCSRGAGSRDRRRADDDVHGAVARPHARAGLRGRRPAVLRGGRPGDDHDEQGDRDDRAPSDDHLGRGAARDRPGRARRGGRRPARRRPGHDRVRRDLDRRRPPTTRRPCARRAAPRCGRVSPTRSTARARPRSSASCASATRSPIRSTAASSAARAARTLSPVDRGSGRRTLGGVTSALPAVPKDDLGRASMSDRTATTEPVTHGGASPPTPVASAAPRPR